MRWRSTSSPAGGCKVTADLINRYPDSFLFGTDEVATGDWAAYSRVLYQYKSFVAGSRREPESTIRATMIESSMKGRHRVVIMKMTRNWTCRTMGRALLILACGLMLTEAGVLFT